jgi:hypothetical protein
VDHPEEDEELGPGPEALVHGVGVEGGILAETLVEAGEPVVLREGILVGEDVALLGVEEEDEAEDDGEEGAVDLVGIPAEGIGEELPPGAIVGGLDAAEELVESVKDLLGELLGDLVLELAALGEEPGESGRGRAGEEPGLGEEEVKGVGEGTTGGEEHLGDTEVHPAGALAVGGGDKAEDAPVGEEPGGDAGPTEETLEAGVVGDAEVTGSVDGSIEIVGGIDDADEELPGGLALLGRELTDGEVWSEGGVEVGESDMEVVGDGCGALRGVACTVRRGIALGRPAPAEDLGGEAGEVGDEGLGVGVGGEGALLDDGAEGVLVRRIGAVEDDAGLLEGEGGDDEAGRLEVADPLEVRPDFGGELRHRQFDSGQR